MVPTLNNNYSGERELKKETDKVFMNTIFFDVKSGDILVIDKDKNYLRDLSINGDSAEDTYEFSSELKETAKYFRVSFYANSINDADKRNTLKITWEKDNSYIYGY